MKRAYYALAGGQDDRYENLKRLANRVYERYSTKTAGFRGNERIPLPPYDTLKSAVLNQLLDTQRGLNYAARAVLRTQLGLSAETVAPPVTAGTTKTTASAVTNAPPK